MADTEQNHEENAQIDEPKPSVDAVVEEKQPDEQQTKQEEADEVSKLTDKPPEKSETEGGPVTSLPASETKKARVVVTRADQESEIRVGASGVAARQPETVYEVFENAVSRCPDVHALCVKRQGEWVKWTYKEYMEDVKRAAKSLITVGLEPFSGVCIMGFNSPEWFIANFAAIFAGGLVTGIYTTNSPEACHYVIENCSANVVIVQNNEKLQRILAVKDKLPLVRAIVQYEGELEVKQENIYNWQDFMKLGESVTDEALDERKAGRKPSHCCSLVYTSGTTGNPKGVMLSHDNVTFTAFGLAQLALETGSVVGELHVVSYLPLSHIAAQMADMYTPMILCGTVWFAQPDALKGSLGETLKEVRPTYFFGVPRVWEKMMEAIQVAARGLSSFRKRIGGWAKAKALEANTNIEKNLPTPWGFAIAGMLLKKVRVATGLDRCKIQWTGAAPIGRETLEFFHGVNIPLYELYGMSECSGPQNISMPGRSELGKCGPPCMDCAEIRIDTPDEKGEGEVCYRGRHIFMGYLGMEEKTLQALDDDGWLHSGDIGCLDERNFVTITGRIKELIITAGGENIAPVPIENAVKEELPFVSNVMVIGDRRKFLSALVTLKVILDPDTGEYSDDLQPQAADFVRKLGSKATKVSDIIQSRDEEVFKAIQSAIDRANDKAVSRAQKVQKWTLLHGDFTIPGGELGPTLKLKRHVVVSKYKETIDQFYA